MERDDDRYQAEPRASRPSASQKTARRASRPSGSRGPQRKRRRKKKGGLNGHALFFIVLGVILLITIIRLILWNMGKASDYDPNEVTDEFDVELLDYIQPLDPAVLEGREDDGVTTILALGNDPLSDERGDDGLAALIGKQTDSTVLNAAFPGSTIAMKNPQYENSYPMDGLSLYWVTAALANDNFDLMKQVVPDLNSESASVALDTILEVDPETLDAVLICYDLQDYRGGRIVFDESNEKNLNSVYGALNASLKLLKETWPHIRIYVLTPTYGTYTDGSGKVVDADRDDLGNGTLVDYINWMLEASRSNGVTFIDTYYGAVTMEDEDCLTDGFHLNQGGRKRVADRVADVMK